MDAEQEETRRLVEEMLRVTGLTPTELAHKAGLAASTLTRFMNDRDVKHTLSSRTLRKLSVASGVRIPTALVADAEGIWRIWERLPAALRPLAVELLKTLLQNAGAGDNESRKAKSKIIPMRRKDRS